MSRTRELSQPVETEDGERVLLGTRRPDGTVRKERRIRPGYVPQDEQPVYQSRGVLSRQNVPICPGMDPAMLAEAQAQAAKSKAQKKNEKRKEKKQEEQPWTVSSSQSSNVAAVTSQMAKLSTPSQATQQQPANQLPAAAAVQAQDEDPKVATEKALRALRKKVRQAEQLVEKQSSGAALTPEETDKMGKLQGWLAEVSDLEKWLASLS